MRYWGYCWVYCSTIASHSFLIIVQQTLGLACQLHTYLQAGNTCMQIFSIGYAPRRTSVSTQHYLLLFFLCEQSYRNWLASTVFHWFRCSAFCTLPGLSTICTSCSGTSAVYHCCDTAIIGPKYRPQFN